LAEYVLCGFSVSIRGVFFDTFILTNLDNYRRQIINEIRQILNGIEKHALSNSCENEWNVSLLVDDAVYFNKKAIKKTGQEVDRSLNVFGFACKD